jgi:hypothetical protein
MLEILDTAGTVRSSIFLTLISKTKHRQEQFCNLGTIYCDEGSVHEERTGREIISFYHHVSVRFKAGLICGRTTGIRSCV